MSVKYKGFTVKKHEGTKFKKAVFVKYGKEYDIQQYIEAGRPDTEIYPTLKKYGCLTPLERTPSEIYGDFTEYNDLRSTIEKGRKIKNMWDQLPADIKNIFNNDMHEFTDRGMEWARGEVEKANKAKVVEKAVETPAEPKGE